MTAFWCIVTLIALVAWLTSCFRMLESGQEAIMAQIDDAAAASSAKADVLLSKIDEAITTLNELKALADNGNTANAEATLAAMNDRIDAGLARLTAAEDATDPTPDAPPEG